MKTTVNSRAGFTLVELITVIVILGILSAFAIPKFIDISHDARKATVEAVRGAIKSAANLVYAKSVLAGVQNKEFSSVNVNGTTITVNYGYPTGNESGIVNALQGGVPAGFELGTLGPGAPSEDQARHISFKMKGFDDCAVQYWSGQSIVANTQCRGD